MASLKPDLLYSRHMTLDKTICYQALKTRDARFDGRFFTGVTSTGIFCRPVCPATTPKAENCTFYDTASAAIEAGFRPCLRCRPESTPNSPAWIGTEATVRRALRLIEEGGLDHGQTLADFSIRLGISERHLGRLFQEHLGSSPHKIALTRRLMFAKKLLHQTKSPVTEIALAAGFNSLRRFNDAYQKAFALSPSAERRQQKSTLPKSSRVNLRFAYRPPYDWEGLLTFFRERAIAPIEEVDHTRYRRRIEVEGQAGEICITHDQKRSCIFCEIDGIDTRNLARVAQNVRRMFDVDCDFDAVAVSLEKDSLIKPLLIEYPGIRLPGAWDEFEIAVRAIIGQQITVKAARTITTRVVERIGRPTFPRPQDIIDANLDGLGLTGRRIKTLKGLAENWKGLDRAKPVEVLRDELCTLPGIGPWTACYLLMRALGEPDIFPVDDIALIRTLEKHNQPAGKKDLKARAENWRPWRAYGAMYLWKDYAL